MPTVSLRLIVPILLLVSVSVSFYEPVLAETSTNLDIQINNRNKQINNLVRKQKNTQDLLNELRQREWGVVEVLKVLNNNIEVALARLNTIEVDLKVLKEDVKITIEKIKGLKLQIKEDQVRINKQLYALFHLRKVRNQTLFIGLNKFENFFRNQRLLQNSTELDAITIARLKRNLDELEQETVLQKTQNENLLQLQKEMGEQKKLLSFERQQQVTYLHHIRQDRSLRVKHLRDIQVELERLNDVIYSLETKKENEKKAKKFRGLYRYKYSLPSPAKGNVVHKFGKESSRFFEIAKRGILVETSADQEVRSILDGKVVWSGPFRGYNNLVILDHGKGSFSVYGNLDEVFVIVDDVVDKRFTLGTVAFNQTEKSYLFYFETRYNKRAVDPEQWLKKPSWN